MNSNTTLKSSGYAPVNGLKMYYEVHGSGAPLVLLHGSFMTIDLNWSQLIPDLAKTHQVIAVELQGHGRTADIERPYDFKALANDVAALLKHLKIEKASVVGYSFGGTVAIQFGISHPELLQKLVVISSVYKYKGWLPQVREALANMKPEFLDATPLKTDYERVAPQATHWSDFVSKLLKFDTQDFDLGSENLKKINAPVLFIMGDNDGVDLNHVAEMYRLCGGGIFADMQGLPKSQLAIVPGTGHVSLMMDAPRITTLLQSFLQGANPGNAK